ncbi:MAG: hypothetical protein R2744_00590 [Bacteroidales bacterium]
MGSASTYLPGKTGGHHGREIRKGDILTFKNKGSLVIKKRSVPIQERPVFARSVQLRVLPGVNFDLFSESDRDILLGEEYAISTNSDRMGFRLEGRALEEAPFKKELLSYGIQMGAIQVPGDGKPIIMGADAQTTGGYRQFANVITADLDHLAQMKPSDRVNFKITDPDFAIEMLQKKQGYIDQLFRKTV